MENTMCFPYKDQLVNAVLGNEHLFSRITCSTLIHSVGKI